MPLPLLAALAAGVFYGSSLLMLPLLYMLESLINDHPGDRRATTRNDALY